MKKTLTTLSLIAGNVALALAQTNVNVNVATTGQANGQGLLGILQLAQTIVTRLVPFAIGLAVLAFFWYLITFIWKGRDDAKAKDMSLKGMGYAILALFVMVSIWGLVGFLGNILGIGQGGGAPVPGVPVNPSVY